MVSTLLPRRGGGESPRSAERNSPLDLKRKTPRPSGANTLTQFVCPAESVPRKKREPSHEGSLKNQFFRFRKYPRYITAAAMLQKYAIIYGTSKMFSK